MKTKTLFVLFLAITVAILVAGCTQNQAAQQTARPATPAIPLQTTQVPDTIRTDDTGLGKVLVDAQGKTLYYFANDISAGGASACSGQCAVVWPVFSAGTIEGIVPSRPCRLLLHHPG